MSFRLCSDLLKNPAFLERVRVRTIELLVVGSFDPARDTSVDEVRKALKEDVLNGKIDIGAMVMAMFVLTPALAREAVADPSNPGTKQTFPDDRLDLLIQSAWVNIALLGV